MSESKKAKKYKKSSETLGEFLSFWRSLQTDYQYSETQVEEANKATQDLLHQLEFGNYNDRRKFSTQLAHVRQHRRIHKDFIDIHSELYKTLTSPEYVKVYRTLEQLLGQVRKQEKSINGERYYRPRVIKTLTIKTSDEEGDPKKDV